MLEYALLERIRPVIEDSGHPHFLQSAYQPGISCQDAIFATQEALLKVLKDGGKAFLSLFDLEKAFDSIETPVLLNCLYQAGICGKSWRLIKDWYANPTAAVRLGENVSPAFIQQRGVRQGSVLSPTFFLLVMDDMLQDLCQAKSSITLNGLHLGTAAHADDIRAITQTFEGVQEITSSLCSTTSSKGLKLNTDKTEIVALTTSVPRSAQFSAHTNEQLSIVPAAKCLGYWWQYNMQARKAVNEGIIKARKAFFAMGSIGAYQGNLNPLNSRCIFETCIIPVLLYGCENWILCEQDIMLLERFQDSMGKKMLKLPHHHSNAITRIVLELPSIHCRILIKKLKFLPSLLLEMIRPSVPLRSELLPW